MQRELCLLKMLKSTLKIANKEKKLNRKAMITIVMRLKKLKMMNLVITMMEMQPIRKKTMNLSKKIKKIPIRKKMTNLSKKKKRIKQNQKKMMKMRTCRKKNLVIMIWIRKTKKLANTKEKNSSPSLFSAHKTSKTSKLVRINNDQVKIYESIQGDAFEAGSKHTRITYYVKKEAEVSGETYYL